MDLLDSLERISFAAGLCGTCFLVGPLDRPKDSIIRRDFTVGIAHVENGALMVRPVDIQMRGAACTSAGAKAQNLAV